MIVGPNSSGQGIHESYKGHPFFKTVDEFGYKYTHSTPIGYAGPQGERRWFLLHTFIQDVPPMVHTIGLRSNPNNQNHELHWETTCGSGHGKLGTGNEALAAHLLSKAKRHKLYMPWKPSDFDHYKVHYHLRNGEKGTLTYSGPRMAFGINLWNGSVWGVRADGTKMLLKRVIN